MTQPDPTPAAPATEPTPTPAAPATGTAAPVAQFDPATLSPEAKAYLKAQIDAADLKARTTSKANAAAEERAKLTAEFAKTLGITPGDEPLDPAKLSEQIQQAQASAWRNGTELAMYRVAGSLGADAEALLDSNSFLDTLDDLVDVDPRSAEFLTALKAKVEAAMATNPRFKAGGAPAGPNTPRPDPSQGPKGPAAARPKSLSEAVKNTLASRPG